MHNKQALQADNAADHDRQVEDALAGEKSAFEELVNRLALQGNMPLTEQQAAALVATLDKILEANPDHDVALTLYSMLYYTGIGTETCFEKAIDYANRAIALQCAHDWIRSRAMCIRASIYNRGQGEPGNQPNYPMVAALFDQAIALGDARAMSSRAFMYHTGKGEPGNQPNYPMAAELFDQAIALGEPNAMFSRAFMYNNGEGEPGNQPNYPVAAALYDQAIALGHTSAMVKRALMYKNGEGELGNHPNYPMAAALYDQAIALGHVHAIHNRARMYENGEGEPGNQPNYLMAVALYDQAIALGYTGAMNNRAFMYQYGQGEPGNQPNYPKAAALYDQAIALGHASAMVNRALMCENGQGERGNQRNPAAAAKFFRRAYFAALKNNMNDLANRMPNNFDILREGTPGNSSVIYHYNLCFNPENMLDFSRTYPGDCMLFLSEDTQLSLAEKQAWFDRLWEAVAEKHSVFSLLFQPVAEKLNVLSSRWRKKSIENFGPYPQALAAFAECQIQIAENALRQNHLNKAQRAFELADSAREQLEALEDSAVANDVDVRQLHNNVHARMILALCALRLEHAHNNADRFILCVDYLQQLPHHPEAVYQLVDIVFRSTCLESKFTWREKYQLLLTLVSSVNALDQHLELHALTLQIVCSLKVNRPTFVSSDNNANTRIISFDQLLRIASTIEHDITFKGVATDDAENLQALCAKAEHYHPDVEQQLFDNPLVKEKLQQDFPGMMLKTVERALYESLSAEQQSVSLTTTQENLLSRFDGLVEEFREQPETFNARAHEVDVRHLQPMTDQKPRVIDRDEQRDDVNNLPLNTSPRFFQSPQLSRSPHASRPSAPVDQSMSLENKQEAHPSPK